MRKKILFWLPLLLAMPLKQTYAQSAATDSVDVLHYDLHLSVSDLVPNEVRGTANITFVLTRGCDRVTFDLVFDTLFPVALDGTTTRGYSYDADNQLLTVNLNNGHAGDTHTVTVPYVSLGYVESYGWGGLHISNGLYYNLGVAFEEHPHVFGRAWFPCRDNFYDKATYHLAVTSPTRFRHLCGGVMQNEQLLGDTLRSTEWLIDNPTPTYLVSIAIAPFHIIQRDYQGLYDTYPALIGFSSQDSTNTYNAFNILEEVVPMYERAYAPYRWHRIGYVATPKGSMEHVNNIGLVDACIADPSNVCQMTICHELSHAWFGNLVTCASEGDMWINEGGATFSEEVATEAAFGREAATKYYLGKLSQVLCQAHLDDQGYRALSDMSTYYTYGTTTYQKGALVWHSLRGIMGDSLFYSCMRQLFDRCAFGNIDAYALRDSLSRYSGMDLNGFFDFHVFHPGFVDYCIEEVEHDGTEHHVTLRQLLKGTEHYAHGCPVPITFLSADRSQRQKVWFVVDDTLAHLTTTLPFQAAYAIVDLDRELSDACTDDTAILNRKGVTSLNNSFCKIYADNYDNNGWVHVGHHFAHPTGDTIEGITRMADRYWQVTGNPNSTLQGRFLYNQGSNGSSNASGIDLGFYDSRATIDSLCLLYRPNTSWPWQVISYTRTNSSTTATGYFTAPLYPGQYTLAVGNPDLPLMGIHTPAENPTFQLYPNPSSHEFRVDMGSYDKKFNLLIFDTTGKKMMEMNNLSSGDVVRHQLLPGSYVVLIQNNFISLQSQIIIQ